MNLTVRQWTVVSVLAAVFVIAAVVLSRGDDTGAAEPLDDFDEVAWCQAANAIGAWGGILDGSAAGDDAGDITNLRRALTDARVVAPAELRIDIARLIDLGLLVDSALAGGLGLEAALAEGRGQTDPDRLADSIGRVSDALVACGHEPVA